MDDLRLALGEVGHVAAHVVEQDEEIVGPGPVELGELGRERALPVALGARDGARTG